MLVVLAFIFLNHQNLCDANIPASTQANNEHVVFQINRDIKTADVLQEDLQKNNDDYRDILSNNTLMEYDKMLHLNKNNIRRADDGDSSDSIKEDNFQETNANPNAIRQLETTKTSDAKQVDKVNKMMNFLDKHKNLIKVFMKNRTEVKEKTEAPKDATMERHMRASEEMRVDAAPDMRLPSGAQLDMALALGGKVQTMRSRNRLCFRHVLIPEGPKYDSRGKVYLAEFSVVRGRQYHQTRAPKLILPKCCNCCAKSVLGCE